ncbi:MAG TPA: hypothetical protein VFO38_01655 [Candidatus Saccharimonadales bacterium]|nr:hypothetical protein [Candidatus Saccharimonadales bacterium]
MKILTEFYTAQAATIRTRNLSVRSEVYAGDKVGIYVPDGVMCVYSIEYGALTLTGDNHTTQPPLVQTPGTFLLGKKPRSWRALLPWNWFHFGEIRAADRAVTIMLPRGFRPKWDHAGGGATTTG